MRTILFCLLLVESLNAANFIKKTEVSCPHTITYFSLQICEEKNGADSCIEVGSDFRCEFSEISDGTVVEISAAKLLFNQAESDRRELDKELNFEKCEEQLTKRRSAIARMTGLNNKAQLLAKQLDCVREN